MASGSSIPGGLFSFLMSTDLGAANARLARAKNKAQQARNELSGKQASHQTVMQSLSNQSRLKAAGSRFAAERENISRSLDSATTQTAMGMLQNAENMGKVAAMAASAGIGGTSTEAYNETLRTAAAQRKAMSDRSQKSYVRGASDNAAAVMADAYGSMDTTFVAANIDMSDNGDTSWSLFGDLATLGVAAAATAAGAPMVGQAILEAKTSTNYAQAGNQQAATQFFSNAGASLKKSGAEWDKLGSYFKL